MRGVFFVARRAIRPMSDLGCGLALVGVMALATLLVFTLLIAALVQ